MNKKVVLAFVIGSLFGFALGVVVTKDIMPVYTDPSVLDDARESLDGSTNSVRKGMKYMMP